MYQIGIDVGGTNLKAGLVDDQGRLLQVSRCPLEFTTPEALARTLAELARQVMGDLPLREIQALGIGIPGAVEGGNIIFTANIPMKDIPFAALVQKYIDLPGYLANDADCAAAGEYLDGCGRGTRDFVIVTLGTGVGGGMILGGRLQTGTCCAGEVGHMVIVPDGAPCSCGRRGCLESYCSATGLVRMAKEALSEDPDSSLHGQNLNGASIFAAAEAGDPLALRVVKTYDSYLALGLTNLVNILNPQVIAMGGGVADAPEELLLEPVAQAVLRDCYGRHVGHWPKVVKASLGNDAGILGAARIQTLL